MESLSDERIEELVQKWMRDMADALEDARIGNGSYDESQLSNHRDMLSQATAHERKKLAARDYRSSVGAATILVNELGLEADPESHQFKKLCRGLLTASLSLGMKELQHAATSPWRDLAQG